METFLLITSQSNYFRALKCLWPTLLAALVFTSGCQSDPSVNADELALRINRAIVMVNGPQGDNLLKIGDLMIDLDRYEVTISGRRISLTFKEFQLLALLASNPGRVYSREVLLNQLWGYDYLGGTRTVDVHIRRLRSKIEESGHSYLETIWNVGYRFIAD